MLFLSRDRRKKMRQGWETKKDRKREENDRDWRENTWNERQEWEREIGVGEREREGDRV